MRIFCQLLFIIPLYYTKFFCYSFAEMRLSEFEPQLAKPGIPVETPRRREFPEIIYPFPKRTPTKTIPAPTSPEPFKPIPTPREPVPAGR